MIVRSVKTEKVTSGSINLNGLLDKYLDDLEEGSILAISSKVVALCERRTVAIGSIDKQELVKRESDFYLPLSLNKYGLSFSIAHHTLIPAAGIDESNGNGDYVLWPKDPQDAANSLRAYLVKRFSLSKSGVVITDSTARPLHYGTEGVAIGYSGFSPTKNYIGTPDLFGRELKASISNILDALASAAVLMMGEGTEQTPIAVIEDVPFVDFQNHNPTPKELNAFYLDHMEDDLFAPFLRNMGWLTGDRGKK